MRSPLGTIDGSLAFDSHTHTHHVLQHSVSVFLYHLKHSGIKCPKSTVETWTKRDKRMFGKELKQINLKKEMRFHPKLINSSYYPKQTTDTCILRLQRPPGGNRQVINPTRLNSIKTGFRIKPF